MQVSQGRRNSTSAEHNNLPKYVLKSLREEQRRMQVSRGRVKMFISGRGGHLGGCGGHIEVGAETFWIDSYLYVSKCVWGSVKVSLK